MAKETRLELARGLAESREQQLATEVGQLLREKASAEAALGQLGSYLAEYTRGGKAPSGAGRALSAIENERRFVQRLTGAVQSQQAQTQRLAERAAQKTQAWQRARADLQALDKVMTRRAKTEELRELRREQREADAAAARASRRRHAATESSG